MKKLDVTSKDYGGPVDNMPHECQHYIHDHNVRMTAEHTIAGIILGSKMKDIFAKENRK